MYLVAYGPPLPAILTEEELRPFLAAHPNATIITLLDAYAGLEQVRAQQVVIPFLAELAMMNDILTQPTPIVA